MTKENIRSKSKKLTGAICRDLPRLDKPYFKPGDYPGLQFWVKGKKYQQRKRLGRYPTVGVTLALTRSKEGG